MSMEKEEIVNEIYYQLIWKRIENATDEDMKSITKSILRAIDFFEKQILIEHANINNIKPTPLPISFLEWVSFEKYMRLSESAGHKWFKIGKSESYTTQELYTLFVKEIEDEIAASEAEEYNKQMAFEASRFGGI